jgi:hypothetical protein
MWIQYQNISTVMSDVEVAAVLKAVVVQVNQYFARYWNCSPLAFKFVDKTAKMSPTAWQFVIADTSDQAGAAGYHETGSGGGPIGYAFAKTTLAAGMNPSVTISHEILEMIADPEIDILSQWSDNPHPLFLGYEVGDPVEDDQFGQLVNGVLLSDFVTPAYFIPGSAGPWDITGALKSPWNPKQMLAGAYQSTWDPKHGWLQIFPSRGIATIFRAGRALSVYSSPLSRRNRRLKPPHQRVRSIT